MNEGFKPQRELPVEPLGRGAFTPFGDVIETEGRTACPINQGMAHRYDQLATISLSAPEDKAAVSIFRAEPTSFPLTLALMERHPLGSQAFMPLQSQPFLVVVASDPLDWESYRAFAATGQQGVNYHPNIWHHPLIALDERRHFLVIDRVGLGTNLEECSVYQNVTIQSPYVDRSTFLD